MNTTKILKGKHLVSINDITMAEINQIFEEAKILKAQQKSGKSHHLLFGKTLAMIFEKPSLRTRVTFEVAMQQLGGQAIYLAPQDIQLGKRESIADAARNLSRWVDGIMARTFAHKIVEELAQHATIPVINGLTDLEHPCQALADLFTVSENKGSLQNLKFAWVGDGNNVCHSLMLLNTKLGVNMWVATPSGYEPNPEITKAAQENTKKTKSTLKLTTTPFEAVARADIIYTDVWASMGQEQEREQRLPVFQPYQVNQKLLQAAKPDVIVMHCLPAHRGEEITDEVLDGPHSIVLDQAENRLHVQKALLALIL